MSASPFYPDKARERALHLRRTAGLSSREIGLQMDVPKSTVANWIRNVPAGEREKPRPPESVCKCGEELVTHTGRCGWCVEMDYGGEPMPDMKGAA